MALAIWPSLVEAGLTISDRRYWPNEARNSYYEIPLPGPAVEPMVVPRQRLDHSRKQSPRRREFRDGPK